MEGLKLIRFIDVLLAITIIPFFYFVATSGFFMVAAFFIILIMEMLIDYIRIRKYFKAMMYRAKCEI